MNSTWSIGQSLFLGEAIDLCLNPHVSACLELKVSTVGVELLLQRPFDVPRPGVVPLDQVAVIAVHDPHEGRKVERSVRRQHLSKLCCLDGESYRPVRNRSRELLEMGRLDA